MIKLNELRIGNWVDLDGEATKVIVIDSVNGEINYPILIAEKIKRALTETSINPIPITQEIIEKLGFNKVSEFEYELKIDSYFSFTDKILLRFRKESFENWASFKSGMNDWYVGKALSFHQLQNLYFFITGKEIIGPHAKLIKSNATWTMGNRNEN